MGHPPHAASTKMQPLSRSNTSGERHEEQKLATLLGAWRDVCAALLVAPIEWATAAKSTNVVNPPVPLTPFEPVSMPLNSTLSYECCSGVRESLSPGTTTRAEEHAVSREHPLLRVQ